MRVNKRGMFSIPSGFSRGHGFDLNLFIVFEAIFRNRSVTRAAEDLGLSQGAVSHALRRLRAYFNDDLFIKSRNMMIPTSMTIELSEDILKIVALYKQITVSNDRFEASSSSRKISLCVNDFGEFEMLPCLYSEIRAVAPNCTVKTVAADGPELVDFIENGRVDLAICGRLDFGGEVMQQGLFQHPYCIIVSEDSDLRSQVTEEQYLAKEHVVFAARKSHVPYFSPTWKLLNEKRRIRVQTAHHLTVPLIIGTDPDLIAVVPYTLARVFAGPARIRIVPAAFELPVSRIFQYWHRRSEADPYHIWLRGLVRQTFERRPDVEGLTLT